MLAFVRRLLLAFFALNLIQAHALDLPSADTAPPLSTEEWTESPWTLTAAPYVHHWRKSPEHRQAFIFSLEKQQDPRQLLGLAMFRNSFGQPSAYAYAGYQQQDLLDNPRLSAKVTAGIVYGYRGEYANRVPLNRNGYSPGIIPALGYQVSSQNRVQLMLLGTAGFALGYDHNF